MTFDPSKLPIDPAARRLTLRDARARELNVMDECVRSAKMNNQTHLTPEDRERYETARFVLDQVDRELIRMDLAEEQAGPGSVARSSAYPVPNINVRGHQSVGAEASRSLDDMLWATADVVRTKSGAYNSVEQVVIRADAGDVGRPAPRISTFRQDDHALIRSFQETVADMSLFGLLVDKGVRTGAQGFQVARSHRAYKDRWNDLMRAMDVDTTGEGADWVPTGIGATLHEKVRAEGKVAALFDRIDIPTNPWKWPIEGADATAYRVAEPTSDTAAKITASTPGTNAATFDAEIFGVRALTSRFLEADSAVAVIPYMKRKFVQAMVAGEEKAILDGDSDGSHMDSDVLALGTSDIRTAWDGLRKRGLAETSQALTTTSSTNLLAVRKAMGKWGVNPADLAFIVGVSSANVLLGDANLITVDKFGPQATILNGQVGAIFGVPVIVSEHVRENLNASGVFDNITLTKCWFACVLRSEFVLGQRMPLALEVDDSLYRETAQRVVVGLQRLDFQHIGAGSADDNCSVAYNVTSGS